MKIFVNDQHQIAAINKSNNTDLKEHEIEDNIFAGKCEAYILGFCYEVITDDAGNQIAVSIYPYKDYLMLVAMQQQHEACQKEVVDLQLALTQQYEANLTLQEEVTNTQLALAELYEGMGV